MGLALIAITIVAAVAVGVWAERRWPLGAATLARRSLLLMLYVLVPPVIFFNLAATEFTIDRGVGLALGLVAISIAGLLAWFLAARVMRLSRPRTGAVVCAVLCVNSGYLGYPMTVALLGREELSTAVLYDVMVSGPALLLGAFAVGAAFGSKAGETPAQRVGAFFTRNPPLYAAIAGLLAPGWMAPEIAVDLSQLLIAAILPIGFFAVGATLAENAEHGEIPMPPPLTRPVLVAISIRMALVPLLLIALSAPLIDLPGPYLLQAAMPCGLNTMVVAHAYGLDMEIAAEAVTWSTGLAILAALGSLLL